MGNNSQMDAVISAHNNWARKDYANAKKEVVLHIIEDSLRTCVSPVKTITIKLNESSKSYTENTFWLSVGTFEKRGTFPKEISLGEIFRILESLGFTRVKSVNESGYLEWWGSTGYIEYEYKY